MPESTTQSNTERTLTDLAKRAGNLYKRSLTDWMACADVLLEARAVAQHGEWLPFLDEAGVPPRTAQRMIRIADSGLQMRHVTHLGGVTATLDLLVGEPEKIEELVSLCAELDELHEREGIILESATPEQRERIDEALANLVTIKGLKAQLNEATAKLVEPTREIKSLKQKRAALEKQVAELKAAA